MAPQLILFAGPNGSGKSSITNKEALAPYGIEIPSHYINADEITKNLSAESLDSDKEQRERRAFHKARELRREYREQGLSFVFETVFSHPSTLLDIIVPLVQRAHERQAFGQAYTPQIAKGDYSGEILALSPHYLLQKTTDAGTVYHDLLLLEETTFSDTIVSINYKDGKGRVTSPSS